MTGNLPALENPKQVQRKRATFYEFLAAYSSPLPLGDEIVDLARNVVRDPKAPRRNTRLIDYLLRKNLPDGVVEGALDGWRRVTRS